MIYNKVPASIKCSASLTTPVAPLVWYLYRVKMDGHSQDPTKHSPLTNLYLNLKKWIPKF